MSVREILAGRAVVELGLRNKLEAGLKAARARLTAFSGSLKSIGTGLGVGGAALTGLATAAIAPLMAAAQSFASFGDNIQKMAIRTGVSTEALSELGFAAGQSGTDLATVEKGIGKMQRSITDANQGMTAAQDTISALGLDLQKLSALSPEQQFEAVGKAISAIEDPTQRAGMAMQLFGRSGAQLLPLLIDDIGKLRTEARELGLTLTQEDANSAAALTDSFGRLKSTGSAAWLKIGAAIAPAFTAGVNVIAKVTSMITRWIDKNRGLFVGIAAVAAIVGTLGATIVTAGITVFTLGTAIGALAPLISLAFSPLGAGIAALVAGGVAAYYFRDAILGFLAPLAPTFAALQSAVLNFAAIFGETFGGVVAALGSGNLGAAGQIAMAGLTAAFWQGVIDIGGVATTLLDMLGSWIPGLDSIRTYAGDTFASIGTAILAGRWDLAGSIVMKRLTIAITTGWNHLKFLWSAFTIGIITVSEQMGVTIGRSWRTAIFAIADLIVWLGEKLGLLDAGTADVLADMRKEAQSAEDKQIAARGEARLASAQAQLDAARAGERTLRDELRTLEAEADAAHGDAGSPTLDDKAARARQDLLAMIEKAKTGKADSGVDPTPIGEAAAGGQAAVGKLASTGTFSAAAAHLVGVGSKPMEETARNTAALLGVAKKQLKKKPDPQPAFGV